MSVIDNLLTGAYLRTDRIEIRRDLERMLDLFPIAAERRNQAAGTPSGGEQQDVRDRPRHQERTEAADDR